MKPAVRYRLAGVAAAAAALSLGVLAAQPIYRTPWLWLVALVALVLAAAVSWARDRWRLGPPVVIAAVLAAFIVTLVPVAVPQSLSTGSMSGIASGFVDGLAAVALGWKQLLTLTLPVGTYRTVLVPFYLVALVSALLIMLLATSSRRVAVLAAAPMLLPVAFGTVFGAAEVSGALKLGPLSLVAPRETGLWLCTALLAAVWIAWVSSSDRRAALRLGRAAGESPVRRGSVVRSGVGAMILVGCLAAGALLAPVLDSGARAVPRDAVDPALVVRDRPSPLASYRSAKRDAALDSVLFTVEGSNGLPARLRLAVLDAYDGVDFHVSDGAAGLFTRFPSGAPVKSPSDVTVTIGEGYQDIWAPSATLGTPPTFGGPRAQALSDGFYVNRDTGGAIAFSGKKGAALGLAEGDSYRAQMETAAGAQNLGGPTSDAPLVDLDAAPELARWVDAQGVSADEDGVATLIERLRARGYLSHSLTSGEGEGEWLARLSKQYGTKFESSAGGHSLARLENLFAQLNQQQRAAGEKPKDAMLVAGIGDDEQFATAAALAARSLGYEARVVVGVRTTGDGVPGVPVCETECTGANLAAWVEVRGSSGEWVAFDATPQPEQRPQRLEEGEQLPEYPTTPEERDVQEIDPPIGLGEQGEGGSTDTDPDEAAWLGPLLRVIGLSLATAALVALPLLFLPLAKRLRTRRRRRDVHPELQALGAWAEIVDRARDTGIDVPDHATRSEIASVLATRPAVWAALEIDRAVFAREQVTPQHVAVLWDAVAADRDERRQGQTLWQRVRAAYSLRSYGVVFGRRVVRVTESRGE
ncbi:transglutaminase domain-containing protein [Leucobacter sp. HY1908]